MPDVRRNSGVVSRSARTTRTLFRHGLIFSLLIPVQVARFGNGLASSLLLFDILCLLCPLIFGVDKRLWRFSKVPLVAIWTTSISSLLIAVAVTPQYAGVLGFALIKLSALSALLLSGITFEFRRGGLDLYFWVPFFLLLVRSTFNLDYSLSSFVIGGEGLGYINVGGRLVPREELYEASQEILFLGGTKYLWALFALGFAVRFAKSTIGNRWYGLVGLLATFLMVWLIQSKSDTIAVAAVTILALCATPISILASRAGAALGAVILIVSSGVMSLTLDPGNSTLGARVYDWAYFWGRLDELPLALTVGYGANGFRIAQETVSSYLGFGHNTGLNLLVEHGALAAILILYWFFRIPRYLAPVDRSSRLLLSLFILERAVAMLTADILFGFDSMVPVTALTILLLFKTDLFARLPPGDTSGGLDERSSYGDEVPFDNSRGYLEPSR